MPLSAEAAADASGSGPAPARPAGRRDATGRKNMQQLIQLRWIAALGQVVTIWVAVTLLRIDLPLNTMLSVVAGLVAFNLVSLVRLRRKREASNGELFFALLVDVAMLTVQLYLSGGITNPFVFLYLLQVILAAVLLQPWSTWAVLVFACACLGVLVVGGQPLALPLDYERGLASPYVLGLLLCFVLNAVLLVVFITRINHNLRARDARLADLRQRAVEEDHIVRIGLLASGAAHELGTPLATVAVILGDWRRMPALANEPELLQDLDEMQAQVQRCKNILHDILVSAGETRGDDPAATTVRTFLEHVVANWRETRGVATLTYDDRFGEDLRIVSDTALKQMVHNVLDNALEASPHHVRLEATRDGDNLVLIVSDKGPGFAPDMLQTLGTPYRSTKGRPGGGLGLFLVTNVARTLRGHVSARNRVEGGAVVTLTLPLPALTLANRHDRDASPGY